MSLINNDYKTVNRYDVETCITQKFQVPVPNSFFENFKNYNMDEEIF